MSNPSFRRDSIATLLGLIALVVFCMNITSFLVRTVSGRMHRHTTCWYYEQRPHAIPVQPEYFVRPERRPHPFDRREFYYHQWRSQDLKHNMNRTYRIELLNHE